MGDQGLRQKFGDAMSNPKLGRHDMEAARRGNLLVPQLESPNCPKAASKTFFALCLEKLRGGKPKPVIPRLYEVSIRSVRFPAPFLLAAALC